MILYADDLILFSFIKKRMQLQLEIMENFGNKYGIMYNPDKTVYMIFNRLAKRKKKRNQ